MFAVPNVRGALVPNITGSMGSDRGPLRRRHGVERLRRSRASLVDRATCWSIENGDTRAVVHERDFSIKCVQSAVSESEATRAARSRECTASMQGGGAHARDSSIARGARPSGVRNPTQI